MIPEWMRESEEYDPLKDHSNFAIASIKALGASMAQIKIQKGHEKGRTIPPLLKLFMMFAGILLVSIARNRMILMVYAACILLYLCTWPAKDLLGIIKAGCGASILACLILIPAIVMKPALLSNEILIVIKVFFSVVTVSIFSHTTQWNHITNALRQLHIPGLFVFTIDITLKYIVLLGNLISSLLTALQLRSVGKNNKKYQSIGGVMGVAFIRGAEMNRQMYEAMICRGFTDDYKGL